MLQQLEQGTVAKEANVTYRTNMVGSLDSIHIRQETEDRRQKKKENYDTEEELQSFHAC